MEGLNLCCQANVPDVTKKSSFTKGGFAGKKLVVVINDALMDNHQIELAGALEKRGHLYVLPRPQLLIQDDLMELIEQFRPVNFLGGDKTAFARLLDDHMGFNPCP